MQRFKKYAIGAGGMLVLVVAIVLATGSGSAVAAQITNVFVTNDAAHPVPVHEQGTASVQGTVSSRPMAPASPWSASIEFDVDIDSDLTLVGPTSAAIDLTSFSASNATHPDSNAEFGTALTWTELKKAVVPSTATDCSSPSSVSRVWRGLSTPSISVAFPTPLQVSPPAGSKVCLLANTTSELDDLPPVDINASGFFGN